VRVWKGEEGEGEEGLRREETEGGERTLNLWTIEQTMQARRSRMLTPDIVLFLEDETAGERWWNFICRLSIGCTCAFHLFVNRG
jgi:hypothetical protein